MNILWSPLSLKKLDDIVDFIAHDNIEAALALVDEIEIKVLDLKNHPLKGRMISVLNDEMKRELVIRDNYIVVYEIQNDTIEILTIRHAKQDT